MNSEPRFLGVSMMNGTRALFLVAVKSKNVPGALGDIATRLGKAGLNILTANDCSDPNSEDSAVSFFIEPMDPKSTAEDIRKALDPSPFVTDVHVKKSDSKLMIDDFSFPVMYFPAGRGLLFPQSGITAMFQDVIRMFGTGGESILYRAGHSVGTQGTNDIAKALGEDQMLKYADTYTALYSALGWGKMEVYDAAEDLKSYRLKLSRGFESEGTRAGKPSCHFTRGLVAGSSERIFGGPVLCVEEKCASVGDPYCLFSVTLRDAP